MKQDNHHTENPYVVVVGATNVDIMITANEDFNSEQPLSGKVEMTLGGVGRNIALNLAKLGIPTTLITVMGNDAYAEEVKEEASQNGIDLSHIVREEGTSDSFVSIMDAEEEEEMAIDSTTFIQKLTPEKLKEKSTVINQAKLCIVDGNLSNESLEFLTSEEITTPIYLDPGAEDKAEKVKPLLNRFYALKPNKDEAEIWSEQEINSVEDAENVCEELYQTGNEHVFLTLDDGDIVYRGDNGQSHIQSKKVEPVHTIGGGDAFMAGLVYGIFHELDVDESIKDGIAASSLTIQHEEIVRSDLSAEKVKDMIEELEL